MQLVSATAYTPKVIANHTFTPLTLWSNPQRVNYEQRLEAKISEMLSESAFKPYMSVFDKFGFGLRVRSLLLTRIYPFESFLGVDGKPVIEYEVREVKKTARSLFNLNSN